MTKEELYKNICDEFKFVNGNTDIFDTNIKDDKEYYENEFNKVLHMWKCYFFDKNRLVTMINSYEIDLKDGILEHLFNLLSYYHLNEMVNEEICLGLFLILYKHSVLSKEYKKSINNYSEKIREVNILFNKNLEIFNAINDNINYTLFSAVEYSINNDYILDTDVVYIIMTICNKDIKTKVIQLLIESKKYYSIIYLYDDKIQSHKEAYFNYIIAQVTQETIAFDYCFDIFKWLYNKKTLTDTDIKKIINLFIDKVNGIKNMYEVDKNSIELICILDQNIKHLNLLKCIIKDKKIKEKLQECVVRTLAFKRVILSDEEWIDNHMQSIPFSITISNEEEQFIKDTISKDLSSFHKLMIPNVDDEIHNCIDAEIKSPLLASINTFNIDPKQEKYYKGDTKNNSNAIADYINKIGNEYVISKKLRLRDDPYKLYLKHENNLFELRQQMVYSFFDEEQKQEKIVSFQNVSNYTIKNYYALAVTLILAIEANVIAILKHVGMYKNGSKDGYKNLCNLFNYFQSYEDEYIKKYAINGCVYIYYVLYEKSGYNLRNDIMHGNLMGQNIEKQLLMIITCIIIVSGLRNEIIK